MNALKKVKQSVFGGIVFVFLLIGVFLFVVKIGFAWTNPSQTPPGGSGVLSASGTTVLVGGGTGKLTAGTIDPVYLIGGKKYATYVSSMIGQKEQYAGRVDIKCAKKCEAIIDFGGAPEGSDTLLFSKSANLKDNFDQLVVLLSPSFDGRVWYEKDFKNLKLIIHANRGGEVAYHLIAPRFDWKQWPTVIGDQSSGGEGFNLDELIR